MKYVPLLFQPEMVRANLQERKTMTTRIVTPHNTKYGSVPMGAQPKSKDCKWEAGDIIWQRESGWVHNNYMRGLNDPDLYWKADYELYDDVERVIIKNHCCSFASIHMYKEFCRLFLLIEEVKVERLQDITPEDAICEGLYREWDGTAYWYKNYGYIQNTVITESNRAMFKQDPVRSFKSLWLKIHGQESWDQNPLVWRVRYKNVPRPEDFPK